MLKNHFRWKGKLVSEKQYKLRLKQAEAGRRRKKIVTENEDEKRCIIRGRRIVNLQVMGKHMNCTSCKAVLSLVDIEKESRRGLASVFSIRCRDCLLLNNVPTDNLHPGPGKQPLFDVNSKLVSGMMHVGIGCTAVNKLLQTLEIPNTCPTTFQRYQQEMRTSIDEMAAEHCEEATTIKQSLKITNSDTSQTILTEGFQIGFPVPQDTDSSVLLATNTSTQQLSAIEASTLPTSEAVQRPSSAKIFELSQGKTLSD